jgi:hypothetical protein
MDIEYSGLSATDKDLIKDILSKCPIVDIEYF